MNFAKLIAKIDQLSDKKPLKEGWEDMMKAVDTKANEKGTDKFDKKEISTGTQYTRKASTFTDGGDNSDVKAAKKKVKEEEVDEGFMAKAKEFGKKVLDKVAPGDEELLKDLQKKTGTPQTGKPPMATQNKDVEESAELTAIRRLAGMKTEAKKPDADGDGVPDWADKKSGKDDKEEELDESAAPGQEDWIKSNKEKFIKQYGQKKGMEVLYATANKRSKSAKESKELDECYDQSMAMEQEQPESGMNISSNIDTKTGDKSLTITAQGQAAEQLAQIIKLSGMIAQKSAEPEEVEVEMGEEYSNEPHPMTQSADVQFQQGNDMHRAKQSYPKVAGGDNPMAMAEARELAAIEKRLMEELSSIKIMVEGNAFTAGLAKTPHGGKFRVILDRFKHEVRNFETTGDLDDDLYHALYDYYSNNGDMPYGTMKARTGDPYQWVSDHLAKHLVMVEGMGANKTHLAMAYLKAVVMAPTGTPENERIRNWQEKLEDEFDIKMDTATLAQMLPQFDSQLKSGQLDKLQNRMASRGELEIGETQQGMAEGVAETVPVDYVKKVLAHNGFSDSDLNMDKTIDYMKRSNWRYDNPGEPFDPNVDPGRVKLRDLNRFVRSMKSYAGVAEGKASEKIREKVKKELLQKYGKGEVRFSKTDKDNRFATHEDDLFGDMHSHQYDRKTGIIQPSHSRSTYYDDGLDEMTEGIVKEGQDELARILQITNHRR